MLSKSLGLTLSIPTLSTTLIRITETAIAPRSLPRAGLLVWRVIKVRLLLFNLSPSRFVDVTHVMEEKTGVDQLLSNPG